MDLKKVRELVDIVEKSSMLEFSIKEGKTKITMSRRGVAGQPGEAVAVSMTPAAQPVDEAEDELYITSPIVGTFYASPTPDSKPFVSVGDVVKEGQTVCVLEAMKLMNEIDAEFICEIEAVLVSNEQKVEYGQPLFRVKKIED